MTLNNGNMHRVFGGRYNYTLNSHFDIGSVRMLQTGFYFHFHFLLGPKNRNINEKSKKILIIANMKNKVSLAFNVSEKGSKYAQQHDKN